MSISPARLTAELTESQQVVTRLTAAGCVFAADEARLLGSAARTPAELALMVERRVAGLPLEHILGWVEFCGLRIAVDPAVFVPRRRTEFLVEQAADLIDAADAPRPPVVVDMCCGSGAVGAALSVGFHRDGPDGRGGCGGHGGHGGCGARPIELHAVDIDPAAVACARRNITAAGSRVYEGDLYAPLPSALRNRVDVLVANAPYVPTDAVGLLPPEARLHEPWVALDGGADGLDVLRRVTASASSWLAPGGHLLVETSEPQAPSLVEIFAKAGLRPRVASSDRLDATVVIGAR
jgi:release factor glutamine methyltransferase